MKKTQFRTSALRVVKTSVGVERQKELVEESCPIIDCKSDAVICDPLSGI